MLSPNSSVRTALLASAAAMTGACCVATTTAGAAQRIVPPELCSSAVIAEQTRDAGAVATSYRGGQRVSVPSDDGGYRVTVCDAKRTLVESTRVVPYASPRGTKGFLVSEKLERLDDGTVRGTTQTLANPFGDPEAAAAWDGAEGAALRSSVPAPDPAVKLAAPHYPAAPDPATEESPSISEALWASRHARPSTDSPTAAPPVAPQAFVSQCDQGWWGAFTGATWPNKKVLYRTYNASFPAGNTTRQEITKGFHSWDNTLNSCGYGDLDDVSTEWVGTGDFGVHTYDDGTDRIDFGSPANVGGNNSTTVAITLSFWSGATMVGSDMRFNQHKSWTHSGGSSGYDVWNLATHEAGHFAVQLSDTYHGDHTELTMYGLSSVDSTKFRTLARGDIIGMRARY